MLDLLYKNPLYNNPNIDATRPSCKRVLPPRRRLLTHLVEIGEPLALVSSDYGYYITIFGNPYQIQEETPSNNNRLWTSSMNPRPEGSFSQCHTQQWKHCGLPIAETEEIVGMSKVLAPSHHSCRSPHPSPATRPLPHYHWKCIDSKDSP